LVLTAILEHMSINAKKILITTERHEVFVFRQRSRISSPGFCASCNDQVEMMNFDAAISISGLGGHALLERSEMGEVHSIEAPSGHIFICMRSLLKAADQDSKMLNNF
jgi:hypothetical protein